MKEYFDLYDVNKERTGAVHERWQPMPEGCFRLNVALCIFNTRGELLIQKRTDTKAAWPGLWDVSVCGSVLAGETSQQAMGRELKEELGLVHDFTDTRPRLTLTYSEGFSDIYILVTDPDPDDIRLQEEEVEEVIWADKDTVLRMIREGMFIAVYPSLIDLLFDLKDSKGYMLPA
ncbi:MAG: NUDIX domain-containing protein [Parasporobacterium sp.]|nr:NUDIX domain-containing protein [Parasporobacterium sp.]